MQGVVGDSDRSRVSSFKGRTSADSPLGGQMLGHRVTFCLLATFLLAPPAAGQRAGSIEVGVLARGTLFDPSLNVTTALGGGGRLAVYLAPQVFVEADMSTANVSGLASFSNATYRPLHARVNFLTPY